MSYASQVLADAPWAYYRLMEPTGTSWADATPNGRSMAITGVASGLRAMNLSPLAVAGKAVYFDWDSINNYGKTAVGFSCGTDATLECWWYLDRAGNGTVDDYETFMGNGTFPSGTGQTEFSMGIDGTDHPYMYVYDGTTTIIKGASALSQNAWHHFAAVSTATGMKLMVDGVSVATSTHHLMGLSGRPMWLHGSGYFPTRLPNKGYMAEPAIYDKALSDFRIATHISEARLGSPNAVQYLHENVGFDTPFKAATTYLLESVSPAVIEPKAVSYFYENVGIPDPVAPDPSVYMHDNVGIERPLTVTPTAAQQGWGVPLVPSREVDLIVDLANPVAYMLEGDVSGG